MPTKNRRVATYLPPELYTLLKDFIDKHGLKGESLALIMILSEYFGVSQQVPQRVDYSSFVTQEQFNELASKVSELVEKSTSLTSLLGKLPEKLKRLEDRVVLLEMETQPKTKPLSPEDRPVPGQIALPGITEDSSPNGSLEQAESESKSDSLSNSPTDEWLSTKEAWEALKKPRSYEAFRKLSPEKLSSLYGIQFDLQRKTEGKYSPKWLRLSSSDILEDF